MLLDSIHRGSIEQFFITGNRFYVTLRSLVLKSYSNRINAGFREQIVPMYISGAFRLETSAPSLHPTIDDEVSVNVYLGAH